MLLEYQFQVVCDTNRMGHCNVVEDNENDDHKSHRSHKSRNEIEREHTASKHSQINIF